MVRCLRLSVSPGRLERPTYGFEARRSIHLSYGPSAGAVDSGSFPGLSSPDGAGEQDWFDRGEGASHEKSVLYRAASLGSREVCPSLAVRGSV